MVSGWAKRRCKLYGASLLCNLRNHRPMQTKQLRLNTTTSCTNPPNGMQLGQTNRLPLLPPARTCICHLVRQPLLDLQPLGKHLNYPAQCRPVAAAAAATTSPRQVGQLELAIKGQQVVLALGTKVCAERPQPRRRLLLPRAAGRTCRRFGGGAAAGCCVGCSAGMHLAVVPGAA